MKGDWMCSKSEDSMKAVNRAFSGKKGGLGQFGEEAEQAQPGADASPRQRVVHSRVLSFPGLLIALRSRG